MKRLFKNGIYTTTIGVLVLIFTMMMLWFGKSSATEMAGWLTFAITMLRANDTIIGIQKND